MLADTKCRTGPNASISRNSVSSGAIGEWHQIAPSRNRTRVMRVVIGKPPNGVAMRISGPSTIQMSGATGFSVLMGSYSPLSDMKSLPSFCNRNADTAIGEPSGGCPTSCMRSAQLPCNRDVQRSSVQGRTHEFVGSQAMAARDDLGEPDALLLASASNETAIMDARKTQCTQRPPRRAGALGNALDDALPPAVRSRSVGGRTRQ